MTPRFQAIPNPGDALLASMSAAEPANPFMTRSFIDYRTASAAGVTPWALCVENETGSSIGCLGFLQRSRLPYSSRLEIHSLVTPDEDVVEVFWRGVWALCLQERVSRLTVLTFGSRSTVQLPSSGPNELWRKSRCEYLLDLTAFEGKGSLSSNHRRNVNRADRAGIHFTEADSADAASIHAVLMCDSLDRRRLRGERVARGNASDPSRRLMASGAGRIFQALQDGRVLSSVLVLTGRSGAYYHSAGTSPEGMKSGASHLLLTHLALQLKEEGLTVFNLGGTDSEGLARFKAAFGAKPVYLEAAAYDTGNRLAGLIDSALKWTRRLRR